MPSCIASKRSTPLHCETLQPSDRHQASGVQEKSRNTAGRLPSDTGGMLAELCREGNANRVTCGLCVARVVYVLCMCCVCAVHVSCGGVGGCNLLLIIIAQRPAHCQHSDMDGPALVFASTAAGRGDPASPARRWLPLAVAASLVVVLAELFLSHGAQYPPCGIAGGGGALPITSIHSCGFLQLRFQRFPAAFSLTRQGWRTGSRPETLLKLWPKGCAKTSTPGV